MVVSGTLPDSVKFLPESAGVSVGTQPYTGAFIRGDRGLYMSATLPPLEVRVTNLETKYEVLDEDRRAYEEAIFQTNRKVKKTHRWVQGLQQEVWELREDFVTFRLEMGTFKHEMRAFKRDMGIFKEDMGAFKQDMGGFKQEMGGFRHEVRDEFATVKSDVSDLKRGINAIVSHLGIATPEGEAKP